MVASQATDRSSILRTRTCVKVIHTFMEIVKFIKTEEISEQVNTLFESERQKLSGLLPNAAIEHVGGTSILGTITKGDLDINVRVKPKDLDTTLKILKTLYEINQTENWSKEFASFKDDSRHIGVQVTVIDSPEDYFVAQREYLKSNPQAVFELNALKKKFDGKNMNEYRKEKSKFFEEINSKISNSNQAFKSPTRP